MSSLLFIHLKEEARTADRRTLYACGAQRRHGSYRSHHSLLLYACTNNGLHDMAIARKACGVPSAVCIWQRPQRLVSRPHIPREVPTALVVVRARDTTAMRALGNDAGPGYASGFMIKIRQININLYYITVDRSQ